MARRSQTSIVAGFGLGQIAAFACSFYLMGAIGDAVGRDLGLSANVVFATVSLSLAMPALLSPAVARWIEGRGGKGVLLASHGVFAAGLALLACAANGWMLAAAMGTIGLGMALGLSPTPFAILVSIYGAEARRPITAVALVGGLGSVVGWPLTGWLAGQVGWREACLLWAGVQLCLCLPLSAWVCPAFPQPRHPRGSRRLIPGTQAEPARSSPPRFLRVSLGPRVRAGARPEDDDGRGGCPEAGGGGVAWDRTMVQLAVLFACAWFVSTCMSAHLPRLLASFGLSGEAAAATAGLMGLAAVSVRFLEFTVLKKLPPLATTRAATLMHPAGASVLEAMGGAGAAALAVGQGAGNGMLTVAKGVLPLSLYGPKGYAYRSALIGRPAMFAQIAGPSVYALLLERSPELAIAVSSALCLVMFAMTFGLSRNPSTAQEPVTA